MQNFGARLRVLRERTGLSQEAFADSIGMKRPNYGNLERGVTKKPTPETQGRLAKGFGWTPEQFLEQLAGVELSQSTQATPEGWQLELAALIGQVEYSEDRLIGLRALLKAWRDASTG